MKRTISSLSPRGNVQIAFGCSTPAATGIAFGFVSGLTAFLPFSLRITPHFNDRFFAFDGTFSIRIPVASLLAIALSGHGRKVWRTL